MEYVFGTDHRKETLRTKDSFHSELSGFQEIVREYPDQVITDRFLIVRKMDSQEDVEGNCYDWYEIDKHYRFTDKSEPTRKKYDDIIGGERADRMYEVGECFTSDGKFYKATLQIPAGGYIAVGTNVEETNIAAELSRMN